MQVVFGQGGYNILQIQSAAGVLVPANWNSLAKRGKTDITYAAWQEAGGQEMWEIRKAANDLNGRVWTESAPGFSVLASASNRDTSLWKI